MFNIQLCCRWARHQTNNNNHSNATRNNSSPFIPHPLRTNTKGAGPRGGVMFTPKAKGRRQPPLPHQGEWWRNLLRKRGPWKYPTTRRWLLDRLARPGGVAEAGWRVVGICGGGSVSGSTPPNQPFRPATPTKSRTALTAMPGKRWRRMHRTMLPTAGHF